MKKFFDGLAEVSERKGEWKRIIAMFGYRSGLWLSKCRIIVYLFESAPCTFDEMYPSLY